MPKLKTKSAINRIVIGDVGSGKTVVALITALTFLKSLPVSQAALLAPTEVLAHQHYLKLLEYLESWPENTFNPLFCIFLTGKQVLVNGEKITKSKLDKLLQTNPAHIFWVGTQALLHHKGVKTQMVLVDEQHRFGVKQRQLLTQSELGGSHFISFTATPIPRTLALTVYQNLKPHFLPTLPGRQKIETSKIGFTKINNIIEKIKQHLDSGQKVYVICSKVEDGDDDTTWSVSKASGFLEQYFPRKVLEVHGQKKDKQQILNDFKKLEEKPILVATTVVEVGVDVSDATLMIILNAERFGLAALHQIRGRIGRNSLESNECVLVVPDEFLFMKRLGYICQLHDGFEIAQKDLELRGSGDLIGHAQSGFSEQVESLLGLNPEMYYNIQELVDSINLDKLPPELQRLENYLQKQANQVWEE